MTVSQVATPSNSEPSQAGAAVNLLPIAQSTRAAAQQLASLPTADKNQAIAAIAEALWADRETILQANVAGRGVFYRVRICANSRAEAANLCQRLKSAGADCFIGRN